MDTTDAINRTTDEFSSLLADAQDAMTRASSATGERARELHAQVLARLQEAMDRASDLQEHAVERARAAADATDEYVHENPWPVIGAAALVGFLAGVLLKRS